MKQLGRCSLRIRNNDKCVKCKFFVVPGDGTALLRMPDIELPSIMTVMCETIGNKTNDRRFDTQTRHAEDSQKAVQTGAQRPSWMQTM